MLITYAASPFVFVLEILKIAFAFLFVFCLDFGNFF